MTGMLIGILLMVVIPPIMWFIGKSLADAGFTGDFIYGPDDDDEL